MFENFPLREIKPTHDIDPIQLGPFESFSWTAGGKILIVNATLSTAKENRQFKIAWIYEFDGRKNESNVDIGGTKIKYSIDILSAPEVILRPLLLIF